VNHRSRLVLLMLVGVVTAAEHGSTVHANSPWAKHGITVHATSPWKDARGYTPVIVTASSAEETQLSLRIGFGDASASTVLRLPRGQTVRQTLLLPPTNYEWSHLDGLEWTLPDGTGAKVPVINQGAQSRVVLVDPLEAVGLPPLVAILSKHSGGGPGVTVSDHIKRIAPADLPSQWQGYPERMALVLTPAGEAALDDRQRAAIATWARAGGTLVTTSPALRELWRGRGIDARNDDLTRDAAELVAALKVLDWQARWQPQHIPVPGTEAVPVKTFVGLALLFTVVAGPLNLWWVRRRNARHLFLITTPLVSLATCLVLIIASLLADGISMKRAAVQVLCLDHRTQQAVRWTGATYFAAFSQSSLALDQQAKMRVMDPDPYNYRRRSSLGEALHLDWSQDQQVSGMVLPARRNRQLSFIEPLPERRRLLVEPQGAGWRVTNGLGVAVHSLSWIDGRRQVWSCSGALGVGDSAPLERGAAAGPEQGAVNHGPADATADLPAWAIDRLGPCATLAWAGYRDRPFAFVARLERPLDPLPGPAADDMEPPMVLAFGALAPDGVP
jgi:hypothetical protein